MPYLLSVCVFISNIFMHSQESTYLKMDLWATPPGLLTGGKSDILHFWGTLGNVLNTFKKIVGNVS